MDGTGQGAVAGEEARVVVDVLRHGAPRSRRAYCSASFCPSNTAGWQAWPAAASAAHSRAAVRALAGGPAIGRSSTAPGLAPSRIAMTGRSPSSIAAWLVLRLDQSVFRPS